MDYSTLQGVLAFIKRAENLKSTFRLSFTATGKKESSAEHSWRLCLLVMLFADNFPEMSIEKCFKMAVIHDLAEAVCGDTPAIHQDKHNDKAIVEQQALVEMLQPLPARLQQEIAELWDEYTHAATAEAAYVKALDKIETLIQHNQGSNPPDFDYTFNLTYGLEYTDKFPLIAQLRALLDDETQKHIAKAPAATKKNSPK